MKDKIRIILMILFFIVLVLLLCGCSPFLQVNSTIPFHTTKVVVVNNTTTPLVIIVDGSEKARVCPTGFVSFSYWVGSGPYYSSSMQVSVTILDQKKNRSWSDVIYFSSYYKYSYIFTVREGADGRLEVERRN